MLGTYASSQPAARGGSIPAAVPPATELLTDTTFDSGANWTLSTGEPVPVIAGSGLTFPEGGDDNTATQALVGGSVAAGNYTVGLDILSSAAADTVSIRLLGAASEVRGSANFTAVANGQTAVIAATGEVTSFQLRRALGNGDVVVDNPTMKAGG
jgi:hypothetical protein